MRPTTSPSAFAAVLVLLVPLRAQSPCQPAWRPTFGGEPGMSQAVAAFAEFDDGSGLALYAAGAFVDAGGVPARYVAKRSGSSWVELGTCPMVGVEALAVFDDGSGPALYAGGYVLGSSSIAQWDGATWTSLGAGIAGEVQALCVYDDGSGPALYAGGYFGSAGGQPASCIARWDGTNWFPLGSGIGGAPIQRVHALAVYDDGTGAALYATGAFTTAGGVAANSIAKWDGTNWSALGSGLGSPAGTADAYSLAAFDDGSGPALFVGGYFLSAGGVPANSVAKWDGTSWAGVGGGMDGFPFALSVYDDGSGPVLIAGGGFTTAGGTPVHSLAAWDGTNWSDVGGGITGTGYSVVIYALGVHDDGSGPALYAGGLFNFAGSGSAKNIARWKAGSWSALGGSGLNDNVYSLVEFDDGSGPALYAGGEFDAAGGLAANCTAKWNGTSWSTLGSGMATSFPYPAVAVVVTQCVFDDGGGPALYAAGGFTSAGGVPANSIAKWDGTSWSAVGVGVNSGISALVVFDDGSGPALYAGGSFSIAGSVGAHCVAKWNGASWSALGAGMSMVQYPPWVSSLAVYDNGSGPALYAAGRFDHAGSVPANRIAKWNGTSWSALGTGIGNSWPPATEVRALAVFDGGSGPELVAAGYFGSPASNIAKWNGTTWSALGSGVFLSTGGTLGAFSLGVFDDGSGSALYVGGGFDTAGGAPVSNLARWDGSAWSSVGNGVNGWVEAFATVHDGGVPSLCVGGYFSNALVSGDSFVAKWANAAGCGAPGLPICEPGAGGVSACPCGNPPAGSGLGCNNSSNTGGAQLSATGIARITYDTVLLTTSGERPTATSLVLQGDTFSASGFVFGQGVRCVSGSLKRLYLKAAVAGSISAPTGSDLHLHERSAALGDTIAPGTHRYYGVYYSDPNVLGGCPAASGFNVTQQLDVLWSL